MANDSNLFRSREQLEVDGWCLDVNIFRRKNKKYLPLIEGKMFMPFDHRYANVLFTDNIGRHGQPQLCPIANRLNPNSLPIPEYWVDSKWIDEYKVTVGTDYYAAFKAITSVTNERTVISTILPFHGIHDNAPIIILSEQTRKALVCLVANLNSFVFDYCARQKMGTIKLMHYVFYQLPVLAPSTYLQPVLWENTNHPLLNWVRLSILELIYTSWDIKPFAQDCGWSGPPFRWDEERRFMLRSELDAAFFHLYLTADKHGEWIRAEKSAGAVQDESSKELSELKRYFPTPRHAVEHVMNSFPIVKRKDENEHGCYRTKEVILEIYDAMAEAIRTGIPYQTKLNPPPADPSCCHPPKPEECI